MLYAYDGNYKNGKVTYSVLDEDDLKVEVVSEEDCKAFMQSSDLLSMEYADSSDYDFAIGVARRAYAMVVCTDRNKSRYSIYIREKGGRPLNTDYITLQKGRLYMDYINLDVEVLDNQYFVIGFDGMDKHYYREDSEEYFRKSIVFDIHGRKVAETAFEQADYATQYGIVRGRLHEDCIIRGDGKVLEEGRPVC